MERTIEKHSPCNVKGFIVPLEFIAGLSLADLERALGLATGRLDRGAAFALLNDIPFEHELQYFGDTRAPEHRFEEWRNKRIERKEIDNAGYAYLQAARPKLIKVIALKSHDPMLTNDQNWPPGFGAMQYKLLVEKQAMVIDVVWNYPHGRFSYA
jgi:hypothetical protein